MQPETDARDKLKEESMHKIPNNCPERLHSGCFGSREAILLKLREREKTKRSRERHRLIKANGRSHLPNIDVCTLNLSSEAGLPLAGITILTEFKLAYKSL